MRSIGAAVLLLAGSVAAAQVPGGQPTGRVPTPGVGQTGITPTALQQYPAPDPQVVAHLKAWEAKMAGLKVMYTQCEVTREETLLRKAKKYSGSVVCMKPNYARMRISSPTDTNDWEAYLSNGKNIYVYNGSRKELTWYDIPAGNTGVGDNLLMEFMSGSLTADAALRRFDMKLVQPATPDENYLFFEVKPRLTRDKQEFETMQLVLYSPTIKKELQPWTYLPRMVQLTKNNKELVETWNFTQPTLNDERYTVKDFQPVDPGKDWQKGPGNTSASQGPRVARPNGPGK
jgi:TIGR03009 family protein